MSTAVESPLDRLKAAAMAFATSTAKNGSDERRAQVNELRLAAYAFAGRSVSVGPRQCVGRLTTKVYSGDNSGMVLRQPGDQCSLNATVGPYCRNHLPVDDCARDGSDCHASCYHGLGIGNLEGGA